MYNIDKKSILNKKLKVNSLRYNEYYDMQPEFDELYNKSKQGYNFKKLYNLIISNENILLAYRNIKNNKGSKTAGTNKHTIEYIENMSTEQFLQYIKTRFENYIPQKVKRVEIPKSNGKTRPLGIPCIEDRIIQQCIKQILEPICEAKFHPHNYGFRPNRSTEHAIAYTYKKINIDKCYIFVDIDIQGFFDNVEHGKLMKQIWSIGIRDKRLLCIIGKMLKAEIEGIGIPSKGVPQGGILSPLLSNIVLNELDWWISDQWQTFTTIKPWSDISNKYAHQRKSNLKEFYIVRYADDFKICCKNYETSKKIFKATKLWLKERLNLEISLEKSKITDTRKCPTEFLGFIIKAKKKYNRPIVESHMTDKAISNAINAIKTQIKYVQKYKTGQTVYILNQLISGLQNYYKIATHVSLDFHKIDFRLKSCIYNKLHEHRNKIGIKSMEYKKKYANYRGKELYVARTAIYPINFIQTKFPRIFNQNICNYTEIGRIMIHDKLSNINTDLLGYLANNPVGNKSIEYNDNRLSLYSAQQGKCAITGLTLDIHMEVHHIKPLEQGGNDDYANLMIITYVTHKLIHITDSFLIDFYLFVLKPTRQILEKINKYRSIVKNQEIKLKG